MGIIGLIVCTWKATAFFDRHAPKGSCITYVLLFICFLLLAVVFVCGHLLFYSDFPDNLQFVGKKHLQPISGELQLARPNLMQEKVIPALLLFVALSVFVSILWCLRRVPVFS